MNGLLLEASLGGTPGLHHGLRRVSLSADTGRDEKWLQRLLFDHPELIPLSVIDPGAKDIVPVCRELSIPKDGSTIFLDMLAVTPHGRLVLVEMKLWRNPQARREVVAQILEYASLLRKWSYADLIVRLKGQIKSSAANPLYDLVRARYPGIDESAFVDAVSRSLLAGDFDLIVAGDGIRADIQAIAAHLNSYSGLTSRLALLEVQLWEDDAGRTIVIPFLPYRTEIVQHRVIVDAAGIPLALTTEVEDVDQAAPMVDPERKTLAATNRSFWQRFIDTARFDHADQAAPRHGGNNWVKLPFPAPIDWITAYRNKTVTGVFFRLTDEDGRGFYDELVRQADDLRSETGLPLVFDVKSSDPFSGTVAATCPLGTSTDADQLAWLSTAANRFVNAFRIRIP